MRVTIPPWTDWLVLAIAGSLLFVLTACGSTRETAKATIQADQAMEGAQRRLVGNELRDVVATMPPDIAVKIDAALQPVLDLLTQGRESLAPALSVLGEGKPIETDTSAQMAAEKPAEFIRRAQRQAARAAVEAESLAWWRELAEHAATFAGHAAGSSLATGLLGGGGLIATVAALLKGVSVFRTAGRVREAIAAYAIDAGAAKTEAELETVKDRHRKRQEAEGIHPEVVKVIKRVKHASAATSPPPPPPRCNGSNSG